MLSREQREGGAWLFLIAGMIVLVLEFCFYTYGMSASAVVATPPRSFPRSSPAVVTFVDEEGKDHRETLITSFTGDPLKKGDRVTVEYLPFMPSYVRHDNSSWFFWVTGFVCMAIALWELVRLERE